MENFGPIVAKNCVNFYIGVSAKDFFQILQYDKAQ